MILNGLFFNLVVMIFPLFMSKQNASNGKRMKISRTPDENGGSKAELEASSVAGEKPAEESKPAEQSKQDYIHVRARRGQATDSHSLAERVMQFYTLLIFCFLVVPQMPKLKRIGLSWNSRSRCRCIGVSVYINVNIIFQLYLICVMKYNIDYQWDLGRCCLHK